MVRLLGDALHAGKLGESFWLLFSGYVCLNIHYLSVFFLALAASLWIFSLACWLLERNPWLPHTLFYASVQPSTQICQWPFICWMRCASACGHWPQVSMLGDEYGHLRQVSPDSCSSHRSPQMWFHTYPGLCFAYFWLQCAGEPSDDVPWPGQRSDEVCSLSDSGKWLLLWGDQCNFLSFSSPSSSTVILSCIKCTAYDPNTFWSACKSFPFCKVLFRFLSACRQCGYSICCSYEAPCVRSCSR